MDAHQPSEAMPEFSLPGLSRVRLVSFTLLILLAAGAFAQDPFEAKEKRGLQRHEDLTVGMRKADDFFGHGDIQSAIGVYDGLHAEFPGDKSLLLNLAKKLAMYGSETEAVDYFLKAEPTISNSMNLEQFMSFGRMAAKLHRAEDAKQILTTAFNFMVPRADFSPGPNLFRSEGEGASAEVMYGRLLARNAEAESNVSIAKTALKLLPHSAYANYLVATLSPTAPEKLKFLKVSRQSLLPSETKLRGVVESYFATIQATAGDSGNSPNDYRSLLSKIDDSRKIPPQMTYLDRGLRTVTFVRQYRNEEETYRIYSASKTFLKPLQQRWDTRKVTISLRNHTFEISSNHFFAPKEDDLYRLGAGLSKLADPHLTTQGDAVLFRGKDPQNGNRITASLVPAQGFLASDISELDKAGTPVFDYLLTYPVKPLSGPVIADTESINIQGGVHESRSGIKVDFTPLNSSLFKVNLIQPGYSVVDDRVTPPVTWTYQQLKLIAEKNRDLDADRLLSFSRSRQPKQVVPTDRIPGTNSQKTLAGGAISGFLILLSGILYFRRKAKLTLSSPS